jgi:hypothetical protein
MSYWLEDANEKYLGDLATNGGIVQLREAAGPALAEFLDRAGGDAELCRRVALECHSVPRLRYVADLIEGAETPVYVTDGCGGGDANDD